MRLPQPDSIEIMIDFGNSPDSLLGYTPNDKDENLPAKLLELALQDTREEVYIDTHEAIQVIYQEQCYHVRFPLMLVSRISPKGMRWHAIGEELGLGGFSQVNTSEVVIKFNINGVLEAIKLGGQQKVVKSLQNYPNEMLEKILEIEASNNNFIGNQKMHPIVVKTQDPHYYGFIMSRINGVDLINAFNIPYLREELKKLTWDQRIILAYGVLYRYDAFHKKGVVHCDAKPDNTIIQMNPPMVSVIDLGFLLPIGTPKPTPNGTLHYLMPECLDHHPNGEIIHKVGPKDDSLGILACITPIFGVIQALYQRNYSWECAIKDYCSQGDSSAIQRLLKNSCGLNLKKIKKSGNLQQDSGLEEILKGLAAPDVTERLTASDAMSALVKIIPKKALSQAWQDFDSLLNAILFQVYENLKKAEGYPLDIQQSSALRKLCNMKNQLLQIFGDVKIERQKIDSSHDLLTLIDLETYLETLKIAESCFRRIFQSDTEIRTVLNYRARRVHNQQTSEQLPAPKISSPEAFAPRTETSLSSSSSAFFKIRSQQPPHSCSQPQLISKVSNPYESR